MIRIYSRIRPSRIKAPARVVVSLPQGLGRYGVESASASGDAASTAPGFEFYLKNHLGSIMLVLPRPLSFLRKGTPERHRWCRYCEKKSAFADPETEKKRTAYGIPVVVQYFICN